jgi:hypothetical protein
MTNLKRNTLGLLLAFTATICFAAAGDRFIENPNQDKDIIMQVNDGGVKTQVFKAVGSTGLVAIPLAASAMSDVEATRLGLKQYLHGTTYNAGVAPTVSGTGSPTIVRAVFIPYQMQDGSWRMRLNIGLTISLASRSSYNVTINGVTFKNIATFEQALWGSSGGSTNYVASSYASPNTNTLTAVHATGNSGSYFWSGDLELESKPTWAY